jgi:hypothetical protein
MIVWLLIQLSSGAATVFHHPVLELTVYASRVTDLGVLASRVTDLTIVALPTEEV